MLRKKLAALLLAAACVLSVCPPAWAAEPPQGSVQIETSGETLHGTSVYRSAVTLTLTAESPEQTVLIKEDGLWMSLSPGPDGSYTLSFQNDGIYRFQFCTEDRDGQRSQPQEVSFVIGAELSDVVDACRALPALDASDDQTVEKRRAEIMAVQGRFNDLTDVQRAYFPADEEEHLAILVRWLSRMRPAIDVFPPETPLVAVSKKKIGNSMIYPEGSQIKVYTQTSYDVDHIAIRWDDGIWKPMEKQWDNYIETFREPGIYTFDVCAQDAYGNHSPAREITLTISTELYEFLEKASVAVGTDAEQSLLDYYAFDMKKRSMLDPETVERLLSLYEINCGAYGLSWKAEADQQQAEAIGMVSGFPQGNVLFTIAGTESAKTLQNNSKKIFYEYAVSFLNAINGEKVDPEQPVLIRLGVPSFLRSRKGVQMFDSNGNAVESRIRSEDSGLVLEFYASRSGAYYFAASS